MFIENILAQKGRDVFSIDEERTVNDALSYLAKHRVGALLVSSSHKQLAGIMSERDIVRRLAQEGTEILEKKIRDIMTKNVLTLTPKMTIKQAMELMTRHRFRHMPVLDDGALCGVVSIGDVVKYRIQETQAEATALKDYIRS